jgi:hypothetical protein
MLVRLLVLGALASAVAILATAHAQTLLRTLDAANPHSWAQFGWSVAVGDVDGDGKDDVVVSAPGEYVGGNAWGRAYVFSGVNGSLLLTVESPNPNLAEEFGASLAVGDVNGDGKGDITVGAAGEDVGGNPDQGRAYVFSGADGSLLFTLDSPNPEEGAWFGSSVAVGDVNGDGRDDIAVGASGEHVGGNSQGQAYVFSGADGSVLLTLNTPNAQAGPGFGVSVAVGDVNGDGKGDIAVGASGEDVGGIAVQGRAYVFSGAGGSLLFTLDSPNPQAGAEFGMSVAVGDVNGDGKGEIATGALYEDVGGNTAQGRAYVFSGWAAARGIVELPSLGSGPLGAGDSPGVSVGQVAGVAGLAAAAVLSLGGAAWYVRRRWVR